MKKKVLFNKGGSGSLMGRVTIPKEFLEILGITKENNKVNITIKDGKIIIEKIEEEENENE